MYPSVSHLYALFANVFVGAGNADLIEVCTFWHEQLRAMNQLVLREVGRPYEKRPTRNSLLGDGISQRG